MLSAAKAASPAGIVLLAGVLVAQKDLTDEFQRTKGIFVERAKTRQSAPASTATPSKPKAPTSGDVKYNIKLIRGEQEEIVPATHHFLDGDRFRLQLELNYPSYVYVLHRTVYGTPERLPKGIDFIAPEDGRKLTPYRILFPVSVESKLAASKAQAIPQKGSFRMDDNPGLEKLVIVVSPTPIDLPSYLKVGASHSSASDEILIAQLSHELAAMGANARIGESKGVAYEGADSYAVSIDPSKPIAVIVNLAHHARQEK